MLGSKVITFASVLVVLFCVILSITAAPVSDGLIKRHDNASNETLLETDEVAVTSDGHKNKAFDKHEANNIPDDIVQNGVKGKNGAKA